MTEEEWLAAADWRALVRFIAGRARPRKLHLFALAVSRWAVGGGAEPELSSALVIAERFIEGNASVEELARKHDEVCHAAYSMMYTEQDINAARWITNNENLVEAVINSVECLEGHAPPEALYLHDIFGNAFRRVAVDPSWLTPTVVQLAQAAYDERELHSGHLAPARLAVLADALEEAGCDNADLLGHLRGPGPHARGCFAVDLLLGKE